MSSKYIVSIIYTVVEPTRPKITVKQNVLQGALAKVSDAGIIFLNDT